MGMKLAAVMAILVMAMGGVGAWYFKHTQAKIAILQENNAKLEVAVQTNEAALQAQIASMEAMRVENEKLNQEFANIDARNKALENRLSRHDIGAAMVARPGLTEKALNKATINANRCMEIYSGSALTQSEIEATKPSEINPECWRDANPNFNPDIQSDAWKRKNL